MLPKYNWFQFLYFIFLFISAIFVNILIYLLIENIKSSTFEKQFWYLGIVFPWFSEELLLNFLIIRKPHKSIIYVFFIFIIFLKNKQSNFNTYFVCKGYNNLDNEEVCLNIKNIDDEKVNPPLKVNRNNK